MSLQIIPTFLILCAFSVLTLLTGHQKEHLASKKLTGDVLVICLEQGARLFAYGPADATAIPKLHHLLAHLILNSRLVLPFWYRLTPDVLEKRPLNGCSSSNSPYIMCHKTFQIKSAITAISWHVKV